MKLCIGCNIEKELSDFPLRKDNSNRLRPYCKNCVNEINRKRYEHHKQISPFKHKCARAKSRSQFLKVPFDLTPEYLESIWTGVCPVLDVPISFTESDRSDEFTAELDRFIPELGYVKGNVNFLSRKINRLKNSATSKELEQLIHWMKKYENC